VRRSRGVLLSARPARQDAACQGGCRRGGGPLLLDLGLRVRRDDRRRRRQPVRDLFDKAKQVAPSIIFIDELDAIGPRQGWHGFGGGYDEREQTLNQILTEMDGFTGVRASSYWRRRTGPRSSTRRLLRPGRFDGG